MKNRNSGFSLIEVMMVAGLLGMLALGFMKMMEQQRAATAYIETKNEETAIIRNIQMYLTDKRGCSATFSSVQLGSETKEQTESQSITSIKDQNEKSVYKVDALLGNGALRIKKMIFVNKSIPLSGGLGTAELKVTTERTRSTIGAKETSKTILLQARADDDGVIEDCYSDIDSTIMTAKIETCESVGGLFDKSNGKCHLSSEVDDSNTQAVSKYYLEQRLNAIRLELGVSPAIVPAPCSGNNSRIRFKEAVAQVCQVELQTRSCNNGSWSSWSGTYSNVSCEPPSE